MKNQEFKLSTMAMLINNGPDIERLIEKAMNSGAIDVENQNPEDYTTRKALLCVIFQKLADEWMPLTKDGKKEVSNLKLFL